MKNVRLMLIALFFGIQIMPAFSQMSYLTDDEKKCVQNFKFWIHCNHS